VARPLLLDLSRLVRGLQPPVIGLGPLILDPQPLPLDLQRPALDSEQHVLDLQQLPLDPVRLMLDPRRAKPDPENRKREPERPALDPERAKHEPEQRGARLGNFPLSPDPLLTRTPGHSMCYLAAAHEGFGSCASVVTEPRQARKGAAIRYPVECRRQTGTLRGLLLRR
jgi:hypothetical protein